jgi:hypothetical protein
MQTDKSGNPDTYHKEALSKKRIYGFGTAPGATASCAGCLPRITRKLFMADNGVPISSLWQRKFKAAERENGPRKLSRLLKEAEITISARLRELKGKQIPECQAIAKAVTALQQLSSQS